MPEYYYPDIAFLVNFFLDYILLYITGRIRRRKVRKGRLCFSAAAGSLVTVLATALGIKGAFFVAGLLFCGTAMCAAAFGRQGMGRNLLALFFCTFVMGGMLYAAGAFLAGNRVPLAASFAGGRPGKGMETVGETGRRFLPAAFLLSIFTASAGILLFLIRMRREHTGRPTYPVRFCIGETPFQCRGLLDTGNGLYDPFRGKPVLLLAAPEFRLPLAEFCKKQPEKVRYIPYRAVGTKEGILCGAELATVTIETGQEQIRLEDVPAVYAELFGGARAYQVILHPDFFKECIP